MRHSFTVVTVAFVGILAAGCHATRPKPDPTHPTSTAASPVRGSEEAADSVPERDRAAVYRELLRDFYRPSGRQARWINPRPLGEKRGAADTAMRAMSDDEMAPDAGWAESVAESSGLQRVCVLGGAEDDCRGRPGGVLRFSPVYAFGTERVRVYARYTPHGGAVGPASEMRFTLERRGDEWRIASKTSVPTP